MFKRLMAVMLMALLVVSVASVGGVARADTQTVDYDELKRLIDNKREKDAVKLNANDKLTIPSDPKAGIAYQLESLHINVSTGETTTVSEGVARLRLPATDAHDNKAVLGKNDMVIYRGTGYDIALNATGTGFSSYIVVLDENAPTDYEFEVDLPNGYKLNEDGNDGIEILDPDNQIVGAMSAPWAVDAKGDDVATAYKLRGHKLVQTLSHRGAEYPVVADPDISFGKGIYLRWNLADGVDGAVDQAELYIQGGVAANCVGATWLIGVLSGGTGLLFGLAYCATSELVALDAINDLEDVEDDLAPVESSLPDDCTLMVRLAYIGLIVTKIEVEECGSYDHRYY